MLVSMCVSGHRGNSQRARAGAAWPAQASDPSFREPGVGRGVGLQKSDNYLTAVCVLLMEHALQRNKSFCPRVDTDKARLAGGCGRDVASKDQANIMWSRVRFQSRHPSILLTGRNITQQSSKTTHMYLQGFKSGSQQGWAPPFRSGGASKSIKEGTAKPCIVAFTATQTDGKQQ
jgi:hypothetical protein